MKLDLTLSCERHYPLFSSSVEHFMHFTGKVSIKESDYECYLCTLFTKSNYDPLINYYTFILIYYALELIKWSQSLGDYFLIRKCSFSVLTCQSHCITFTMIH